MQNGAKFPRIPPGIFLKTYSREYAGQHGVTVVTSQHEM